MSKTIISDRAIIRLSGQDARGFMQGLMTNDAGGALPVWAALLTPQGKALFDFILWDAARVDGSTDLLIDCERARADALCKRLTLYRLRRPLTLAVDDKLAVHWCIDAEKAGAGAVPDPRLPALGHRWIAPVAGGANAAGEGQGDASADYRAHRLSLGVTEGAAELGDGATLWLECNAADLHGVSFTKGCYVGQENTARMNWRNKVNRRLIVVPLDEADGKRQVVAYPDLALCVEHRRVEDIPPTAWRAWMQADSAGEDSAAD
ncbi:MAG: YgfZ/GcvT domain-containing protein [Sphingopyxis sp.]